MASETNSGDAYSGTVGLDRDAVVVADAEALLYYLPLVTQPCWLPSELIQGLLVKVHQPVPSWALDFSDL